MKQTKKGESSNNKIMQLEKSMLASFGASLVALWKQKCSVMPHAVMENSSSAWWAGSSYSYRGIWVSVLYCFDYTFWNKLHLRGLSARQDFSLHSTPSPPSSGVAEVVASSPKADWTGGLWGAPWHVAEDESALSSFRESNHSRNYLTRLDSGFYLPGVPFFC